MRARLNRLGLRDFALFVIVAGMVATVVVFIGREAGLGESAEADIANDLSLTLSVEPICETTPAQRFWGSRLRLDEDGNAIGRYDVSMGWAGFAETPVRWTVTGGTAPYTLQIDGESRDGFGSYEGASGTASVSCALTPGEVFYKDYDRERRYSTAPVVDSGRKTITATVTDTNGATANASVDVYVILGEIGSGHVLRAGQTYRVFGLLVTIPEGVNAKVGVVDEPGGGESALHIPLLQDGYRVWVVVGLDTGKEYQRVLERLVADGARGAAEGAGEAIEAQLHAQMDALVESVGQTPSVGSD